MKKKLLLIICTGILFPVFAQTEQGKPAAETEIRAVIDQLFLGMKNGDSAMVRSVFVKNANLSTAFLDKSNRPALQHEKNTLNEFVKAVGTPHKNVWNEKIYAVEIKQDHSIASVWAPYSFYLDDQLIHCGVNTFQLALTTDGWKIVNLLDSRSTTSCK